MITIFTATYNRAYILPKLYESLIGQTNGDFEWLIVDDGSTDNTEEVVSGWKCDAKIPINYMKIPNGGKSNAVNVGVQNAKGNIFFIVDSDDYITENAVELILQAEREAGDGLDPKCGGFCFKKCNYNTGKVITSSNAELPEYADSLELAFKYNQNADKAEVFYTDVLKQFPFPSLKNNKFVPEALVWFRIAAAGYKMLMKDEAIYMCEYIEDGYTKNFKLNLKKNNKGFALFYKECLGYDIIDKKTKIKYFIRYLQCRFYGVFNK